MKRQTNRIQAAQARGRALANKATQPQKDYLAILMNDGGFGTRIQQEAFLSGELERDVKLFNDDLTFDEAHQLIKELCMRTGRG